MRYLNNSQDVIWNSHFCSGAHCSFQHSPSVTEIPVYFPVELQELECHSFLDSHYSSCTISLGCDWMGEQQAHHWQELFVVSPEYASFSPVFFFGYHTLHFSAGCMAVPFLQWNTSENASKFCKDPITLNKEKELIYLDTVHGERCSGKQKAI